MNYWLIQAIVKQIKTEKKMKTAVQTLWEWIDANYHEDSFNLNDAREKSISLEKQQIERAYSSGAADAVLRQFKDSETYYKTVYKQ